MKVSNLDLFLSGDERSTLMVESEVKELSKENVLSVMKFSHEQLQPVIDFMTFISKQFIR